MLQGTVLSTMFAFMNVENAKAQMRKGILELCILGIIEKEKEAYPSDIIQIMKKAEIIVVEGTLYPLLSRLKKGGLLQYKWVESNSGPPRKYYTLTGEGSQYYLELKASWFNLSESVSKIIK